MRVLSTTVVPLTLLTAALSVPAALAAQAIPERDFAKPAATIKDLEAVTTVRELAGGKVLFHDRAPNKLFSTDMTAKPQVMMQEGPEEKDFRSVGPGGAPSAPPAAPPGAGGGRGPGGPGGGQGARRIPNLRFLHGTDVAFGNMPPVRPPSASPTAPPARAAVPVIRMQLSDRMIDTIVQLMEGQAPRPPLVSPQMGTFTLFIGTQLLQPVDTWTLMNDGTVAVLRGATYRLEFIGADGSKVQTEPVPFTKIAVTNGDKKRLMDPVKEAGQTRAREARVPTTALFEEPQNWPPRIRPFAPTFPCG